MHANATPGVRAYTEPKSVMLSLVSVVIRHTLTFLLYCTIPFPTSYILFIFIN